MWQDELKNCITRKTLHLEKASFPIKITQHYNSLIDWKNSEDPIKKMVYPSTEEKNPIGVLDPSDEKSNVKIKGLQHKYSQTVLLLISNTCACNCRFCFRRRFVGTSMREIVKDWDEVIKYIGENKEINNALLSGGDPFLLSTDELWYHIYRLSKTHINFVRIGTRILASLPSRIDNDLLFMLGEFANNIIIVTHFNHPRELSHLAIEKIIRLRKIGITLSNQTVLLRGVNNEPHILAQLNEDLVRYGIMPYYVFQQRPALRTLHFAVPIKEGVDIINKSRDLCNGIAKRFRYVMSHTTGKIEILGSTLDGIYLRYHQKKGEQDHKIFYKPIDNDTIWLGKKMNKVKK